LKVKILESKWNEAQREIVCCAKKISDGEQTVFSIGPENFGIDPKDMKQDQLEKFREIAVLLEGKTINLE
jgi:hypothetical protein